MTDSLSENVCRLSQSAKPPHITAIYVDAADGAAWCFTKIDDRRALNAGHIAGVWQCGVTGVIRFIAVSDTPTAGEAGGGREGRHSDVEMVLIMHRLCQSATSLALLRHC